MKSITPLLAIPVLAALVLVGCNQNSPSSSTDAQSTNSNSLSYTNAPAMTNITKVPTNTTANADP